MSFDLQKAGTLKRFSAYLLDIILLLVLITGLALGMSAILGIDNHINTFEEKYKSYEEKYGIDFDITEEDYLKLSEAERLEITDAYKEFAEDPEVVFAYNLLINLTLVTISISVLVGYLILEFAVPLFLGNGQTVGKKIFGISVMQADHTRITSVVLFIRAILGKCTIGTMVPIFIVLMIYFGSLGPVGTLVLLLMLILQIALMIFTKSNSTIHDILSSTVVVDHQSQLIFDNKEALIEYQKKKASEEANNSSYFS